MRHCQEERSGKIVLMKENRILITNFDGFNVHNPAKSGEYIEFKTLTGAEIFAKVVKRLGWKISKSLYEDFTKIFGTKQCL